MASSTSTLITSPHASITLPQSIVISPQSNPLITGISPACLAALRHLLGHFVASSTVVTTARTVFSRTRIQSISIIFSKKIQTNTHAAKYRQNPFTQAAPKKLHHQQSPCRISRTFLARCRKPAPPVTSAASGPEFPAHHHTTITTSFSPFSQNLRLPVRRCSHYSQNCCPCGSGNLAYLKTIRLRISIRSSSHGNNDIVLSFFTKTCDSLFVAVRIIHKTAAPAGSATLPRQSCHRVPEPRRTLCFRHAHGT